MPKPIRSELAARILARLHAIGAWPFKDRQFARIVQEMDEGKLELLAYCAIAASDPEFNKKIIEAIDDDNTRHAPVPES